MTESRYSHNPDLAWRVIDGEVVILKIKTTTYYSLDPVGSFVWTRLQSGPRTRDEICDDVVGEFEVERATARADLDELFADLSREELVLESRA